MEPSRQPPCGRTEAYQHTTISRVPFSNCRGGVIGLAIAGNPENDGDLSPWQGAVGHQIIPDTPKNGCANERAILVLLVRSAVRRASFPYSV